MKELYILTYDGGDGSYYPKYTFNKKWIDEMEEKHESGELDYEDGWADGDGFHYETLNVPNECTIQSLGIRYDCSNEGQK